MNKKLTKLFFFHLSLFFLSQTKPPESYSLIRGVNENINLNSGLVNLDIPLFNISEGAFGITNTLSYESRGFVPHITPSYVGLNWNMIQFGKITRESRRIDFTTSNTKLLFGPKSKSTGGDDVNTIDTDPMNYFRNDCINVAYPAIGGSPSYKKNILNNPFEKNYYASTYYPDPAGATSIGVYHGRSYNYEPDKYYFDFMGYKGYFVVDNEGKPIVYCETASLKVNIQNYGCHDLFGNITFSQFIIDDDKGNQYFFGGSPNELDINYSFNRVSVRDNNHYVQTGSGFPINFNNANKTNYIDSWFLKKIKLNDGSIVNAYYKQQNITVLNNFRGNNLSINLPAENGDIPYYDNIGFPDKQTLKNNNLVVNHVRQFFDISTRQSSSINPGGPAASGADDHNQIDTYTKRAILDSITFNSTNISYKYIDSNNSLELTNNYLDKIIIKNKNKIIKEINLIYKNLGSTDKRTFLNKVTNTGNEDISFEYYNTDSFPPYKNSYYTTNDLGYWNGMTTSNPDIYQFLHYGFADDLSKFNVGLLKKVIYPTKGNTTYFYENGDYSKIYKYNDLINPQYLMLHNENKTVNAPRIYKKIENSLENQTIETIYSYKNDDNYSSGIIDGVLNYRPSVYNTGSFTRKNSSSNLLSQNSLHYSLVTENMEGKGFVKYKFTDRLTNPDIMNSKTTENPQRPSRCGVSLNERDKAYLSKQYERGKLLRQEVYNLHNVKIKETAYEYNNFLNKIPNLDIPYGCSDCKISDLNYYVKVINFSPADQTCILQTQYIPVIPYLQTLQTTKEYFDNKIIESTKGISYNDGAKNWHPYPIEESLTTPIGTSIKRYLYAPDLIKKDCRGFRGCSNENSAVGSQWDIYDGMIHSNFLVPLVEITKNTDNKFSLKENLFTKGLTFLYSIKKIRHSLRSAVLDFDSYNIPLVNNIVDNIDFNVYDNKANNLQNTQKNSIPTTTIYGYDQTLLIATINGISYEQLMQIFGLPITPTGYLSLDIVSKSNSDRDEASEQLLLKALDNFRNNPALSNYQITTYTYDPLIGLRSITPPSGIRESYLYDSAGRLQKVVDANGKVLKEMKYNYKN